LRHSGSQALFQYWNNLRAGRPAPERREVEPSDVRNILGDTFILEVSMQMRTIAFRLAGTRLCAAHGRELKGFGYLALWNEEDNFDVARAVNRVYQEFIPTVLSYTAVSADERLVDYESVLLPLMPVAGGNARVLGIATPRTNPFWLGSDPLIQNIVRNIRNIEILDNGPTLAAELNYPNPIDNKAENRRRRVQHLTVLDGGLS
jgi:hypothetical protein